MPFVIPAMPLNCNIWHDWQSGAGNPAAPDIANVPCNLSPGKRDSLYVYKNTTVYTQSMVMEILLPALTDVRPAHDSYHDDLIECPAGSGVYYDVIAVGDVAKGFANAYRMALCQMYVVSLTWGHGATTNFVVPIP